MGAKLDFGEFGVVVVGPTESDESGDEDEGFEEESHRVEIISIKI